MKMNKKIMLIRVFNYSMDPNQPAELAKAQSQATNDASWGELLQRIMALTTRNPRGFASQPFANRAEAILEAVVPSRKNPTHEKVLTIVNALIDTKAIRPDEAGGMFNALLDRVSKYNSMNVQTNLDRLGSDVRTVIALKERASANNLGSITALNSFIGSLPATVERGQETYTAFISALRLLVTEVPQTEVYRSGPNYYLQTSRNGTTTVNLTTAFENLKNIWGVNAPVAERNSISSILTPNTRLLLLLVAPFADSVHISRASYIGYLLTLYRETLGETRFDERTFDEITSVSRALGSEDDVSNLQATLNFLLTNKQKVIPKEHTLTPHEERILRFVQQAVSMHVMAGTSPSNALDETSRNFEPSFYAANRIFINKLMDYFHRAAAVAPDYFINAVLNPKWIPPEGFFTGVFDFPENDEEFVWDDIDSNIAGDDFPNNINNFTSIKTENEVPQNNNWRFNSSPSLPPPLRSNSSLSLSERRTRPTSSSFEHMLFDKDTNIQQASALYNNDIDKLIEGFSNIKTYKQEMELERMRNQEEEDDWRKDRFLKFEGNGLNMFNHLKPKGKFY
ncbi:pIIIa [bottlenose dolphin adenovirus 2]|uniref:PIIIa n=1 Tax=bottlenose dolphin adenovirus 2 TaxID=2849592 RepID=A0A0M4M5I3_9ADEN|nr:pIIIa [Bottlenose dolphin adenovirus 1]ALE15298.1 pIIIa [Bottlenose dolphin adenovirus 1]